MVEELLDRIDRKFFENHIYKLYFDEISSNDYQVKLTAAKFLLFLATNADNFIAGNSQLILSVILFFFLFKSIGL